MRPCKQGEQSRQPTYNIPMQPTQKSSCCQTHPFQLSTRQKGFSCSFFWSPSTAPPPPLFLSLPVPLSIRLYISPVCVLCIFNKNSAHCGGAVTLPACLSVCLWVSLSVHVCIYLHVCGSDGACQEVSMPAGLSHSCARGMAAWLLWRCDAPACLSVCESVCLSVPSCA